MRWRRGTLTNKLKKSDYVKASPKSFSPQTGWINLSRKDETEELAETDEKVTVLAMKRFKEGKVKYRIVNPDETES